MTRTIAAIAILLGLAAAPASFAQAPAATSGMTQPQALSRLESAGLRNIRNLAQQSDGTWRAQVTSAQGEDVQAMIDTSGNITLNTGVANQPRR